MKRTKRSIGVIVILLCVSVFGCAREGQKSYSEGSYKVVMSCCPNFMRTYDSIAALTVNSEKIAIVRVLDERLSDDYVPGSTVPSTINQIKVLLPIYNCKKGEIIEHFTIGGLYEGTLYTANDIRQLEKGREYLLFMNKNGSERYSENNYDEGRFLYEDGKVTNVKYDPEYKDTGHVRGIKDYGLDRIIATIDKVMSLSLQQSDIPKEYQSYDDYIPIYNSWEELLKESDAVCEVSIGSFVNETAETNDDEYFDEYFEAVVNECLYGETGERIRIETMNMRYDDFSDDGNTKIQKMNEYIDDPWMNEGEQYLVFLSYDRERDIYNVVGRSQGRLRIQDNKVTSLDVLYPERIDMGLQIEGAGLEKCEAEIMELTGTRN